MSSNEGARTHLVTRTVNRPRLTNGALRSRYQDKADELGEPERADEEQPPGRHAPLLPWRGASGSSAPALLAEREQRAPVRTPVAAAVSPPVAGHGLLKIKTLVASLRAQTQ